MDLAEHTINALLLSGFLLACLAPVWAVFYFGASRAVEGRAKRLIKWGANVLGGVTALVYVFMGLSIISCQGGNMLYGFGSNCSFIPQAAANLSLPAFLVVTPSALLLMIAITIVALIMNSSDRKKAPPTP